MRFSNPEDIIAITPEWKGERFPDGRPKVPDKYLDALYDLLTDTGEQTFLWVYPHPQAEAALGDYLSALLDTLRDAAAENPALNLFVVEEEDI